MLKTWLKAHRSFVTTAASVIAIVAVVVTTAVVSTGYPAQKVELNDASVWVSNGAKQYIGRANTEILELNTVVASDSSELDVVQGGSTVLLFDEGSSKADIVDPATSTILDSVPMPTTAPRLFLAGDNVVVADGDGQVWIVAAADFEHFDPETQPNLSLGGESVFAMGEEGRLIAYSQAAGLVYLIDAAGTGTVAETQELAFGDATSTLSVTLVGSSWAVFDSTTRLIVVDGTTTDLSGLIGRGDQSRLQEPAASGDGVLVAFPGGLLSVPVSGDPVQQVVTGRTGLAAAPIVVNGCAYAAWTGGTAWRSCVGEAEPTTLTLRSMPLGAARLMFESNGDRVVLNDPRGGGSWAVQDSGQLIDNWDALEQVQQEQEEVSDDDLDTPPDYEKLQQPPVAVDDEFGARPGRSAILPVLLNDYDSNGDVLVVSHLSELPESMGRLDLVNNAQQVQLTLPEGARGTVSFGYTITDGRGGEARANVVVTVRQPDENSPPEQVRRSRTVVAQGGRATVEVLGDWVDPDGDSMYLAGAATGAPDIASFQPNGTVVFIEGGAAGSSRSVALVVTDGTEQGSGNLAITVSPAGDVPILTDPFVVLAYAGQEVTVHPLAHVRGGTGTIRLSSVPSRTGADISVSADSGTFRFSSSQARTFNLEYVVTDGEQTATGVVRIDVASP
ncbi:MAG TPA: Ig-like domain-containing protein, partial [Terrimesophilobacter sp.]|nr:Ig-like domain-containing protein [Terrimesophilobacter sp.]